MKFVKMCQGSQLFKKVLLTFYYLSIFLHRFICHSGSGHMSEFEHAVRVHLTQVPEVGPMLLGLQ